MLSAATIFWMVGFPSFAVISYFARRCLRSRQACSPKQKLMMTAIAFPFVFALSYVLFFVSDAVANLIAGSSPGVYDVELVVFLIIGLSLAGIVIWKKPNQQSEISK